MTSPEVVIKMAVDEETGRPLACYIRAREGQVEETREIKPGLAFADYDEAGQLLGIELLGPCEVELLKGES